MKIAALITLLVAAVSPAFAIDPAAPSATIPAGELPAVSHWVYLSELPESADLLKDAAANGLIVKRLDRTSDKIVVTYVYPDGVTASLGYALLSSAGNADRVAARPEPAKPARVERIVRVVEDEPEIIYEPRYRRTRYIYRDPIDDFWLPLTLGVGIGWATGYHGHGGWHGYGHAGWHR